MSTDYFLWSPSRKRAVMVGSWGMSGVQTILDNEGVKSFIRWAIEDGVADISFTSEHDMELHDLDFEQLQELAREK